MTTKLVNNSHTIIGYGEYLKSFYVIDVDTFDKKYKTIIKILAYHLLICNFIVVVIKTNTIMKDLIWLIVVILLIGWAVGYFAFGEAVGNLIHILLVLAVIGILYRLATGNRP